MGYEHVNTEEPNTIILRSGENIGPDREEVLTRLLRNAVLWWHDITDRPKFNKHHFLYDDVSVVRSNDDPNIWRFELVPYKETLDAIRSVARVISESQISSDPELSPLQWQDGTAMNEAEQEHARTWIAANKESRKEQLERLEEQYQHRLDAIYIDAGKSKLDGTPSVLPTYRQREDIRKTHIEYQNKVKNNGRERMEAMLKYVREQTVVSPTQATAKPKAKKGDATGRRKGGDRGSRKPTMKHGFAQA